MAATFADVMPVKQASSHEYEVDLETAWCIGTVANGGYVTSAFMLVAQTHMQKTHANRNQPDVVNLHLEFLRRTSVGKATFHITDVKLGSRTSNLHITLRQPKDISNASSPTQDEVQGYLTMSNIETEAGPTNTTSYRLHPPPLPVSLSQLDRNQDTNYILRRPDPYSNFRRATKNMAMYAVRPTRRTPDLSNPAIADQWVRFIPVEPTSHTDISTRSSPRTPIHVQGAWTNSALGFISDMFPQLHERLINPTVENALLQPESEISHDQIAQLAEAARKQKKGAFWCPTLLLNLDVKKKLPAKGVEWLFVRVQSKAIRNGRFDLMVEIWDDPIDGELVALSTHAALIVDASRNLKTRGDTSKI